MENVSETENIRLKKLIEICLQLVKDDKIISDIYENTSKTKLLSLDMNKFLKVKIFYYIKFI